MEPSLLGSSTIWVVVTDEVEDGVLDNQLLIWLVPIPGLGSGLATDEASETLMVEERLGGFWGTGGGWSWEYELARELERRNLERGGFC